MLEVTRRDNRCLQATNLPCAGALAFDNRFAQTVIMRMARLAHFQKILQDDDSAKSGDHHVQKACGATAGRRVNHAGHP